MQTMQNFYNQLFSTKTSDNAYWSHLAKLTQLRSEQVASLQTVLWWDDWRAENA